MRLLPLVLGCSLVGGCAFDPTQATNPDGSSLQDAAPDARGDVDASMDTCRYVNLEDSFSTALNPAAWTTHAQSGDEIASRDGRLEILSAQSAFIQSSARLDLRDARISVEVIESNADNAEVGSHLAFGVGNDYVSIFQKGGFMNFGATNAETKRFEFIDGVVFDAEAHRFWQLRESAGVLYAEVAGAEGDYTAIGQLGLSEPYYADLIEAGAIFLWSEIDTEGGLPEPAALTMDNLNTDTRCSDS